MLPLTVEHAGVSMMSTRQASSGEHGAGCWRQPTIAQLELGLVSREAALEQSCSVGLRVSRLALGPPGNWRRHGESTNAPELRPPPACCWGLETYRGARREAACSSPQVVVRLSRRHTIVDAPPVHPEPPRQFHLRDLPRQIGLRQQSRLSFVFRSTDPAPSAKPEEPSVAPSSASQTGIVPGCRKWEIRDCCRLRHIGAQLLSSHPGIWLASPTRG